jgi:hypothetical protein
MMVPTLKVSRWTRAVLVLVTLAAGAMASSCDDQSVTDATRHLSPRGAASATVTTATFPLKASANGRYMIDQNGAPFFMVGGSPQNLASFSMQDASLYLSTRAGQGFNSMQIYTLAWDFDAAHSLPAGNGAGYAFRSKLGGGAYAGAPGTADFSTPNLAYFDYLDQVLDLAASHGLYVHLYAIDYGFDCNGTQGWWTDVVNNPVASLQSFGTFLGTRYKNRSNIIWVDGSDCNRNSDPSNEQKVVKFLQAMQAAGATQLRTGDWSAPSLSTDETLFTPYMQLNGIYSYNPAIYADARRAWNYVPVTASQGNPGSSSAPLALPAFEKETDYELSAFSPGDPASVRKMEYWTVLSGGTAGFFFENEAVVRAQPGWQTQQLDTPAARDAGRMGQIFQSIAWWKLVPSELSSMRRLVTSASGSQSGLPGNYVAAAQASDGSLLLAYVPPTGQGSQSLTVDLRSMAGTARARWWDPTSGNFTAIGNFSNAGTQTLSTPGANASGANDWLLVLDVASGTTVTVTPPTATVPPGGSVQFSASATANGQSVAAQPTTWSVTGGGSIDSNGLYTAGSTAGGPFTVTATSGTASGTAAVTVTNSSASPIAYVQGAAVDAGTVSAGSLAFSAGNTAHNLVLVAVRVGSTTLQTTVTDSRGNTYRLAVAQDQAADGSRALLYYASDVAAGANTVSVQLNGNAMLRFAVYEYSGVSTLDRIAGAQGTGQTLDTGASATTSQGSELVFALGITADPVSYTVGTGYTVRHSISGKLVTEDRIVSAVGAYHGTASIDRGDPWAMVVATFYGSGSQTSNQAPTVATAAAASPSPVTARSTNLSVLGADDGGESALTYTWATTGTPPAPVTFSSNGTNASKNVVATFAASGTYGFLVTIRDAAGLATTSSVNVSVSQTLSSTSVSPASATVAANGSAQFAAAAKDQFGAAMANPPTFTWTVSGGGSISSSGLFTAGGAAGGPFTVTATSGTASGTAAVTVTNSSTSPIAYVQGAAVDAGIVSVGSLAFSAGNTAHNLVLVAVRVGSTTLQSTVTDSRGNTYRLAVAQDQSADGSRALLYYASDVAAGANTVSVQVNGNATLRFAVYEYSGVSTLDRIAGAQGTGQTLDAGVSATTSQGSELVFALGITADPVSYTVGTGYTVRHSISGKLVTEDRIVSAVGAYRGTASIDRGNPWAMVMATFY